MSINDQSNNKRIVKNTMLLYMRMILLMAISFFTSRAILQTLGVEDYGIYNVVGGFVMMFTMITGALSTAISRFLTVELGKGDVNSLRIVFSSSLSVQSLLSLFVCIFAEVIGIWFINSYMQIPEGRETATIWVLQCSILSFVISLIVVPYNALIVAHEKMSAFAYFGILEAILKLFIVYALWISPIDQLILYAILMFTVQLILLIIYSIYCTKNFEECSGKSRFDKLIFKKIWGFAGWSLLGNSAGVLNIQGVSMIMNVFFGVVVNASRGIANQINGVVQQFVMNFTTAVNPQIIKSYSIGDKDYAFSLVCKGAKFSYYLMFCIALPIMMETDAILELWLGTPPPQASEFVVWTLMGLLPMMVGFTLVTLINAHGDIKQYQIVITLFGLAPFPLSWLAFYMGYSVISSLVIYFVVYYILIYVRLIVVHIKTLIPYSMYMKEVIFPTHLITATSIILPLAVIKTIDPSWGRLILTTITCVFTSGLSIYLIGINKEERRFVNSKVVWAINKIKR